MKLFIKAQLKKVNQLKADGDEVDEQYFDDMRSIIYQTEMRAVKEGHASVVRVCQIRAGGITADYAREVLAACFEAYQTNSEPELITIDSVAEMVDVHPRTIRRRWYDKSFPPPIKIGRRIRWRKLDVENYRGKY